MGNFRQAAITSADVELSLWTRSTGPVSIEPGPGNEAIDLDPPTGSTGSTLTFRQGDGCGSVLPARG